MTRKALIHVGTHKTGTKSIQLYLSRNWDALRSAGHYIPNAGRHLFTETSASPGHHDLARDLAQGATEQLDALIAEVTRTGAPSVWISSEEFHPLAYRERILAPLRDALAHAGYESTAIVYLRAQSEYAQSLYAELSKESNTHRFSDYLLDILKTGGFGDPDTYRIEFTYSELVLALARIFGERNVVVRPFDARAASSVLIQDALAVTAAVRGPINAPLSDPSVAVNVRLTFRETVKGISAAARERVAEQLSFEALLARLAIDPLDHRLDLPFDVMSRDETIAFAQRFCADNARASIVIPNAREDEIAPEADVRWNNAAWQRSILDFMTDVWFR